ncbi:MAG: sigma 54-interacting transcriptional regulator [Proteobacteria bacterium]|nr:sigma 54-interacting transcriptional regulator [Pseudomonadota bacterium]
MEKEIKTLENINKPALIIDYAHKIVYANKWLSYFLNKPIEEIIGEYCYNAITCDLCFKDCPFLSVFEHNTNFEKKNINYYDDLGEAKSIDYSISPFEFDHSRGALITLSPSLETNEFETNDSIQQTNKLLSFFENAMDIIDEGIVFVDENFKIFKSNKSMENITGYSNIELIGQPCPKICHIPEGYNCPFDYCYKNNKDRDEIYSIIIRKNSTPILVKAQIKLMKELTGQLLGGIAVVKKILDFEKLKKEYPLEDVITESDSMKEVISLLAVAGFSNKPFLISGQTGTGKKFLASKLRIFYKNPDIPLFTLNTKGLTSEQISQELFGYEKDAFEGAFDTKQGLIEKANNGILIIDDICDLSLENQNKLLTVLKNGINFRLGSNTPHKVSFQLVAITSKDLKFLLDKGLFNKDLYEIISSLKINLPTLLERKDDIQGLVEYFLSECRKKGKEKNLSKINDSALAILYQYPWEGNVQELKNVVEHIYFTASSTKREIGLEMLPETIRDIVNKNQKIKSIQQERDQIIKVLRETNLDRNEASKILGYSRITLWRKIKQYNITIEELLNLH